MQSCLANRLQSAAVRATSHAVAGSGRSSAIGPAVDLEHEQELAGERQPDLPPPGSLATFCQPPFGAFSPSSSSGQQQARLGLFAGGPTTGSGVGRARAVSVLVNRSAGGGNAAIVRGFANGNHRDISIPDFSQYRRPTTADPTRRPDRDSGRAFTYLIAGSGLGASLTFGKWFGTMLVSQWSASKDVLALAKIEVNLADIPAGKNVVLKWRGKPLFIKHRTEAEIARERAVDVTTLRDPEADEVRVRGDPKWLVLLGVCTHLGCVPIAGQGDYGGYYCPCHGSHYDAAGRIRKGPAPLNLEVPEYEFLSPDLMVVG